NAVAAAAMAPAPTKAKPKCGTDTSMMAATNATASHTNADSSDRNTGRARLYAEQRPAVSHAGPRRRDDHQHGRKPETDHLAPALRCRCGGRPAKDTTHVNKDDSDHHRRCVLDGPEAQGRRAHRGAKIVERGSGEWTEDEIQHQAEQQLDVREHQE